MVRGRPTKHSTVVRALQGARTSLGQHPSQAFGRSCRVSLPRASQSCAVSAATRMASGALRHSEHDSAQCEDFTFCLVNLNPWDAVSTFAESAGSKSRARRPVAPTWEATAAHLHACPVGVLAEGAFACVRQRDSFRVSLDFPQENWSANSREKPSRWAQPRNFGRHTARCGAFRLSRFEHVCEANRHK